jgi:tight adherence protein B
MFLLVFTFIVLLIVLFTVLMIVSKPSKHQLAVEARFGELVRVTEKEDGSGDKLLRQTEDTSFPLFDQILSNLHLYGPLKKLIVQANSKSSPGKVVIRSLGLTVGGFLGVSFFSSIIALQAVGGVVGAAAPTLLLRFQRARRLKAFNDALADSIDLMARALRAGHSVSSAIEVVAEQGREPVASEFAMVYQQQNFGLPFRDSLMTMSQRFQSNDLQFVITAMLVQKETGGNLAEILDRTTEVIRERLRIYGEIKTKSAQGRMTGWILSIMPVCMALLLNFVNPGFEKPLFENHTGRIMLYAGAGMLVLGSFVINKIVKIEV